MNSNLDKEESEKRRKLRLREDTEDFLWVMDTKQGRRFIWRLLEDAGVFQSSFTGNSETFFREGQRNVGLKVLSRIHDLCPDKYSIMLNEATNDRSNN